MNSPANWTCSSPRRLKNIFELRPWLAENTAGKYRLIVLDALYRLIPEGIDENSNSDMTRVFNAIDQIADAAGRGRADRPPCQQGYSGR